MKVLSIREPYATFIKEGLKTIETRSWKTNYRGKLLIHAGKSKELLKKIDDDKVLKLTEKYEMNYGNIICEVTLVDCIYMNEEYVEKMKKEENFQYSLGVYKVGRYAWVLENVKVLDNPIVVKGKLGLWEYHFKEN